MLGATKIVGLASMIVLVTLGIAMPVAALQELPPMVIDGTVYIDGELAPDGTLVGVTVDGETIAFDPPVETRTKDGRPGHFVMTIEDTEEEDATVVFFVDGEAAQVLIEGVAEDSVPLEAGFHRYDVTIGTEPDTFVLTMTANGNGQTVPEVGQHIYPADAVIRVGAVPDAGWQFDGWVGDVADENALNTSVIVDTDKTVTASFSPLPVITPTATSESAEPTVAAPSPTPTEAETATPEATAVGTEPAESPTPEPSPTGTEAAESPTPGPSPTGTEVAESPTSGPSPTAAEPAGSPTSEPSPTSGEAGEPEAGESPTSEGDEAPSPTPGVSGEETSSPAEATAAPAEDEDTSGGSSALLIAAAAFALLGAVAIGFGVYGLRRKGQG